MISLASLPSSSLRLSWARLATPTATPGGRTLRFTSSAASTTNGTPVDKRKAYSHTLRLPKTSLPMKHKDVVGAEQKYRLKICDELYKEQIQGNKGPLFVNHDGPPYANGHLHMGHALNKVLKDIINRSKVIQGHRVHYVPGWDCHGLPIEQKALKDIGKSHTTLTPSQIREEARKVALEAIKIQKGEMKVLGVMADWDGEGGTYQTLDHHYEVRQLRLFQTMVEKGFVTHRLRPVYYSPSSRTALAEAELEYLDKHKSRSVYVRFPVAQEDMSPGLRAVHEKLGGGALYLAIWTTTPWTLPANSGVAAHPDMEYVVVRTEGAGEQLLVVAKERVEPLQDVLGPLEALASLTGADLSGTRYTHLFHPASSPSPRPTVYLAQHVTSDAGTGLVHSAPAHGHDDYVSFVNSGILPDPLRCPLDDDGRFTEDVVAFGGERVRGLVGKAVLGDGVAAVVELLQEGGDLLAEKVIEHRYPYDWKTKKPIIVRATPQWFADVGAVKEDAIAALSEVQFHPQQGRQRLESFVNSRGEWCISRQRSWGVPIPALFDASGQSIIDSETLSHIINVLDAKGVSYWWEGPVEEFVPPSRRGAATEGLTKGYDTLDVWFDSGSSWTLLREAALRPEEEGKPLADVYLEGSDQHRGWFQSSLLTKVIGTEAGEDVLGKKGKKSAPYGTVITHGFVLDERGEKMSKSQGNGLSPMEIIHGVKALPAYGADTLRIWAATVDYTGDVSVGPSSISQASEILRRLRNVTRFMLASTAGSSKIGLGEVSLRLVDRYVLDELSRLEVTAKEAYDTYTFSKVVHAASTFTTSTLSTMYFDFIKDTLYCDAEASPDRRAVVAVLQHVLGRVMQIIAPITPHLAQELYEHAGGKKHNVFMESWVPDASWIDKAAHIETSELLTVKSHVLKLVHQAHIEKHVKTGSQAELYLVGQESIGDIFHRNVAILPSLLGVSRVIFSDASPALDSWSFLSTYESTDSPVDMFLLPAKRHQCPRCWLYNAEVEDQLCGRCAGVV